MKAMSNGADYIVAKNPRRPWETRTMQEMSNGEDYTWLYDDNDVHVCEPWPNCL